METAALEKRMHILKSYKTDSKRSCFSSSPSAVGPAPVVVGVCLHLVISWEVDRAAWCYRRSAPRAHLWGRCWHSAGQCRPGLCGVSARPLGFSGLRCHRGSHGTNAILPCPRNLKCAFWHPRLVLRSSQQQSLLFIDNAVASGEWIYPLSNSILAVHTSPRWGHQPANSSSGLGFQVLRTSHWHRGFGTSFSYSNNKYGSLIVWICFIFVCDSYF